MLSDTGTILSLGSLLIGFDSGGRKRILLPKLDASASEGELIAIIGRNGIGKSTLLRTMAGLQEYLGGNISYSGRRIEDFKRIDLARTAAYISTETVKVSNMTVYDLVSLGRYPYTNWYGNISSKDEDIINDAMEKTFVSSFRKRFISELSDGERQKAMIARMLAQNTGVMLMDEPTAFLDIESKFSILHLLNQLSHEEGKTIIYTTHDLHMAIGHTDKIWLMLDSGLKEGSPEDLIIAGEFDQLFSSSSIQFNSQNGTFSLKGKKKGCIFIEGEGLNKHWTKEAIRRVGFSVSEIKTVPYIQIVSDKIWRLISADSQKEFHSIYELVKGLSGLNVKPI